MSHSERIEDYLEHIADAIEREIRYSGRLRSLAALEHDDVATNDDRPRSYERCAR